MRSEISMQRFAGLYAFLLLVVAPYAQAEKLPLAVLVDVTHVSKDKWRVDYRFAQPVTALKLGAVGDFRAHSWTMRTPGLRLDSKEGSDIITAGGKPFRSASVEFDTFGGMTPKTYAPFLRFSDGGTAVFLGHLQGDVLSGKIASDMATDIRLHGMQQETVIAPPPNTLHPGGERGYAYFGTAQPVRVGSVQVVIDPQLPAWARDTVFDVGAKMAQYYEQAYGRPLKNELFMLLASVGYETNGISINGGFVMGQLAYRFEGKQMLGDDPRKRDLLTRIVAHEMAHVWQMNIARGGIGEAAPWIHEGGAEAMALEGLAATGLLSTEKVAAYRAKQTATCDKLGNTVDSYDGIYACGLVRFDKLGMGIVPLWRAMMQATEQKGEVYSEAMINGIAAGKADVTK